MIGIEEGKSPQKCIIGHLRNLRQVTLFTTIEIWQLNIDDEKEVCPY